MNKDMNLKKSKITKHVEKNKISNEISWFDENLHHFRLGDNVIRVVLQHQNYVTLRRISLLIPVDLLATSADRDDYCYNFNPFQICFQKTFLRFCF